VVIKKATDPVGLGNQFTFGSSLPCAGADVFTLTGAPGEDTFSCALDPSQLGTHFVNEFDPSPFFELTALVCDDTDSTTSLDAHQATIQIARGETVTCTFTNTQQAGGTVVVGPTLKASGLNLTRFGGD
jgi:hypothetical protein